MAQTVDPPNDNPGDGPIPPTGANTKIAVVVTKTAYAITEDQIVAAGGPWPSFKVKVTPINENGAGTPMEVEYPAP